MLLRIAFAFYFLASLALAHDPGLSSADVTVDFAEVRLQLRFAPADLQSIAGYDPAEDPGRAAAWEVDGRDVAAGRAESRHNVGDNVEILLVFPRAGESRATLRSALLGELPRGHRQLLTVRTAAGGLLDSRLLHAEKDIAEIALSAPAGEPAPEPRRSFGAFLLLGVEHILTGYDHLLFLAALLLVCESLGAAVKVITAFTLAHSLTLALATFDLVTLPASVVEPVIAASIVFVGIENVWSASRLHWRWLLTLGFGLIHGMGFASVLRDLGVGAGTPAEAVLPLVAFNLGVELGQLGVAALLLPLLLHLRSKPRFVRRGIPALSLLIASAGAYWMIERLMG